MGNCQAIDAAALVIQHPDGKLERLYWPVSASEVMRTNPGHYVSLIIPLPMSPHHDDTTTNDQSRDRDGSFGKQPAATKTVRFTRVKLLRPSDTLALGHAYRLITSQEVMKVLRAKKHAKMKQKQQKSEAARAEKTKTSTSGGTDESSRDLDCNANFQGKSTERRRPRIAATASSAAAGARSKPWRPSLQRIDEGGS